MCSFLFFHLPHFFPIVSLPRKPYLEAFSSSPSQSSTSGDPFASSFTASLQGTLTQNGPDANGNETLRVDGTLSNGAQGTLSIVLQGAQNGLGDDGGLSITSTQVTLGTLTATQLYQGYLTGLPAGDYRWRMTALLAKSRASASQVQLSISMNISTSGHVSGTIQGYSTSGQSLPSSPNANNGVQE